jgi:hypothetical protein
MRRTMFTAVLMGLAATLAPTAAEAQQGSTPLEVGAVAPDFELPAATRHGVLAEPVRLSDYEGETVVLSFFFRARTKG